MTKFKKQPDKYIYSRLMRYSTSLNVWVDQSGTYAFLNYKDPSWNRALNIYTRPDGSKYLDLKFPGIVELDELVADCYVPKPMDGRKYELVHKDGNKGNCSASNLEWRVLKQFSPLDPIRSIQKDLWVNFDGTVWKEKSKKNEIRVTIDIGDSDTDRIVPIPDPYISYRIKNKYGSYEDKHISMDELMDMAEFVDGDKTKLKRPQILHKDGDYLNWSDENLAWVEEDSPEYQAYQQKKKEMLEQRTIALNPNHPNPLMKPRNMV